MAGVVVARSMESEAVHHGPQHLLVAAVGRIRFLAYSNGLDHLQEAVIYHVLYMLRLIVVLLHRE